MTADPVVSPRSPQMTSKCSFNTAALSTLTAHLFAIVLEYSVGMIKSILLFLFYFIFLTMYNSCV